MNPFSPYANDEAAEANSAERAEKYNRNDGKVIVARPCRLIESGDLGDVVLRVAHAVAYHFSVQIAIAKVRQSYALASFPAELQRHRV